MMFSNAFLKDKLQELQARQAQAQASPVAQIAVLKSRLARTDYKAIKHSEGLISEEDYAPVKVQRQALRDQINALETQMEANADD